MIHVLDDNHGYETNDERRMVCGIVGKLPDGDQFFYPGESGATYRADCPACNPGGPRQLGTPLSQLSGRPGQPGYDAFKRIAASWGYD